MPKKRKKWKRHYYLAHASGGFLDRNPYPRNNKLIRTDATPDEKRSPAANADKRQG